MRRAGAIFLGATFVALVVWLLPLDAARSVGHVPVPTRPSSTTTTIQTAPSLKPASLNQVERLVAASGDIQQLNAQTGAELSDVYRDNLAANSALPIDCISQTDNCVFGDTRSDVTVVLFGDSHARMWLPAITPIVTADHLKLVVIGELGCSLAIHRISRLFGDCASVIGNDIKVIDAIRPAAIILSDRTTYSGVTSSQWQAGLTETIDGLRPSGAKVAMIGDIQVFNPGASSDLLQCIAFNASAIQHCAVPNPNAAALGQERAEETATSLAHDLYINPNPWLCTRQSCSPVIGDTIAYWDAFHVSKKYSAYLSGVMGSSLSKFLRAAILAKRT